MGVHLPHDILVNHILPRVPAKSVCRFKCVSKEWHSFLRSDMFLNKHNCLHVNDHNSNFKFLILSKNKTSFEFTTINCEAPPSDHKGLSPTRRPLPPFKGITPAKICMLASGHGLVCLGIHHEDLVYYSDLILWNPLTNEYKRLATSREFNDVSCSYSDIGLYYNSCEDDYKLLHVSFIDTDVYIYSLKSDSWRKVHVSPHNAIYCPVRWIRGTYLNENIYFLRTGSSGQLNSIIRFDTKTEELSKIKIRNVDVDPNACHYCATIMVKSDCIFVCVKYDITCDSGFGSTTCIKLWKLDYSARKMRGVASYQLRTHVYDIPISSLIPFHLMKNGNWLMRACHNHQIYKVDLKKKMQIKGEGEGKEKGNICDDLDYEKVSVGDNTIVDEEVRYVETFVSPKRYMKQPSALYY